MGTKKSGVDNKRGRCKTPSYTKGPVLVLLYITHWEGVVASELGILHCTRHYWAPGGNAKGQHSAMEGQVCFICWWGREAKGNWEILCHGGLQHPLFMVCVCVFLSEFLRYILNFDLVHIKWRIFCLHEKSSLNHQNRVRAAVSSQAWGIHTHKTEGWGGTSHFAFLTYKNRANIWAVMECLLIAQISMWVIFFLSPDYASDERGKRGPRGEYGIIYKSGHCWGSVCYWGSLWRPPTEEVANLS